MTTLSPEDFAHCVRWAVNQDISETLLIRSMPAEGGRVVVVAFLKEDGSMMLACILPSERYEDKAKVFVSPEWKKHLLSFAEDAKPLMWGAVVWIENVIEEIDLKLRAVIRVEEEHVSNNARTSRAAKS